MALAARVLIFGKVLRMLAHMARSVAKLRFRLRGHRTVFPIETPLFHRIVEDLVAEGWRKRREYAGIDAWIDYGSLVLARGRDQLRLEWDNWDEGSIEGPPGLVEPIAARYGLPVVDHWRWSIWDHAWKTD